MLSGSVYTNVPITMQPLWPGLLYLGCVPNLLLKHAILINVLIVYACRAALLFGTLKG